VRSHRPLRAASGALALLLVLAGCQTTSEKAAPTAAAAPATPSPETAAPAGVAAAPNAPAAGTVTGIGEAANRRDMATAAQVIRFSPEEFLGFSPERVLPVLGAPDFVRRDGNAQIWQYRANHCVLDLFLYQNGSETRVKHAELRPRVATSAESVDSCYTRMRQERKTKPAG
jgi:hypothetical protein